MQYRFIDPFEDFFSTPFFDFPSRFIRPRFGRVFTPSQTRIEPQYTINNRYRQSDLRRIHEERGSPIRIHIKDKSDTPSNTEQTSKIRPKLKVGSTKKKKKKNKKSKKENDNIVLTKDSYNEDGYWTDELIETPPESPIPGEEEMEKRELEEYLKEKHEAEMRYKQEDADAALALQLAEEEKRKLQEERDAEFARKLAKQLEEEERSQHTRRMNERYHHMDDMDVEYEEDSDTDTRVPVFVHPTRNAFTHVTRDDDDDLFNAFFNSRRSFMNNWL